MIKRRFTGKSTKPQLDHDFGSKMIEKESELDRACSIDVINELVQLYTSAIEYFSYTNDKKSYDFQEKMHKLFLKPEVIQAMRLKSSAPARAPVTMEERKQESAQIKSQNLTKSIETSSSSKEKDLNRLIDYQKLRNLETARKAAMDFKQQDKDLQKRLASRKKSMLTKSMESFRYLNKSQNNTLLTVKEEDPLGVSFANLIEEEEDTDFDKLEQIMERYCLEKASRSAMIQVKYESEINQIEGEGIIFEQIRTQLRKDLQSELINLSNELESKRAEEIHEIKHRHRKNSISYS